MTIGGYDLLYSWPEGYDVAKVEKDVLDFCKVEWPDMVVEYDGPHPDRTEFFVYENTKAKELWDKHGYNRRYTHNSMIYVIIEGNAAGKPWAVADKEMTVVVDNPNGYKVRKIVEAINNSFLVLP